MTEAIIKSQAVTQLKADMFDLLYLKSKTTFKINFLTPYEVENFLHAIGFTKFEIDTNGWQWDYWITYKQTTGDVGLTLSGSGFAGDMEITLNDGGDEEEDE